MKAQSKIERARWWAVTEQPFYGSLAMSLADVMDSSLPTSATDGRVILWNPDFIESLTEEEVRFVLLHETLHCAHQHLWRLPLDQRGNMAGDYEINLVLQTIPGIKMPDIGCLCDDQYRGMACEEILARLPDDEDGNSGDKSGDPGDGSGQGQGQGQGQGKPQQGQGSKGQTGNGGGGPCWQEPKDDSKGDKGDGSGKDGMTPEQLKDDWESRVIQAVQAQQAMGQGNVPADMDRILDKVRRQTVDWRREMSDFVRDAVSMRNDWSRSARRHAWQPVIYPRRMVDSYGTIVFVRDTSGSVNDTLLAEYSSLISDCMAEMQCSGIVLDCDATVQAEYRLDPGDDCPLHAKGGGGTDFRPALERAEEFIVNGEQIAGLVYLTDMMGRWPDQAPSEIATLWLATTDRQAPFGRTVRIEVKNY
jgi:predicted metal-dependent peptidase